jgi:4-hydroxybenzoyl-CoA thioesterase
MSQSHIDRVRVEFGDCDPAGIVFFPNFFRWFDAASRQFFSARGLPPWRELEPVNGIIGTPLVSVNADFAMPATYGDLLEVHTMITEWKNKSFIMQHQIRRAGALVCSAREVRIFAIRHPDDANRIKAVRAPDDIRRLCQ